MLDKQVKDIISIDEEIYVGRVGTPAGQVWKDEVIKQNLLTEKGKHDILLVYFKNGFTCNAKVVEFEEK